jgi:hypothetical protein
MRPEASLLQRMRLIERGITVFGISLPVPALHGFSCMGIYLAIQAIITIITEIILSRIEKALEW